MAWLDRFWDKIDVRGEHECWLWTAGQNGGGYGSFTRAKKKLYPHRVMFELEYGPIPKGLEICHSCRNRNCVNPEHLGVGTRTENLSDKQKDGTHCKGSKHNIAKLKETDIPQIRALLSQGLVQSEIARMLNVSQATISLINTGKYWKHVP